MLKQRHQLFVFLLSAADAAVATLACYTAWSVRRLSIEGYFPPLTDAGGVVNWLREPLVLLALPILILSMWGFGLYRPRRDGALMGECAQTFKASVVTSVCLIVLMWAGGEQFLGGWAGQATTTYRGVEVDAARLQLSTLAAVLPLMLIIQRMAFRLVLRALRRRGRNLRHVMIVGTGRLGRITCRTLDRNSWTGIHVSHFLYHGENLPSARLGEMPAPRTANIRLAHTSGNRLKPVPARGKSEQSLAEGVRRNSEHRVHDRPVLGGLADLEDVIESTLPDAVYLALPSKCASVIPGILRRLERYAVDVKIIPDVHPRYMPQSMVVGELEGMPILSIRENPMMGMPGIVKSCVDIIGAVVAIIVFSPLMIAAALAVRLSSPGPVIFKQRRVSIGGEVFNIYKFRTMFHVQDEEQNEEQNGEQSAEPHQARSDDKLASTTLSEPDGPKWTTRDDPRVTRVGRLLRRSSLDELPQLFNVLVGDMSLVGPRPERPELIERFRDDWRGYMLRQHVKAGITGWAQVNGLRGDTSLRKRLQLDLFYIRHWSLGFDLRILWLTLFRGFINRNAH